MKEQCGICGEICDESDMVECFYCGRPVCRDCTTSCYGVDFVCRECDERIEKVRDENS